MTTGTYVLQRIEALEAEIAELRKLLAGGRSGDIKSLEGILGPVDFSEDDFEEAKRSLSKSSTDDEAERTEQGVPT